MKLMTFYSCRVGRLIAVSLIMQAIVADAMKLAFPRMFDFHSTEAVSKCILPHAPGRCRGTVVRWYFDTKTLRCHKFVYGGCGGNENNFHSKKDCQHGCRLWVLLHRGHGSM